MRLKQIGSFLVVEALIVSLGVGGMGTASVQAAAKKASLQTKKISIVQGKTKTIKLKNKKKNCKYRFKTNKKKVATVTSKGKVKGVKAGKAKITVTEVAKKGKGKKRKVGVVKVTVKAKSTATVTPANTTAPTGGGQTSAPGATASSKPVVTQNPTAPAPDEGTTSVKVYMDSIQDDNLIAEVNGPGTVPTPEPKPTEKAEATPEPTPQVIYDLDFEDGEVEPFEKRGDGAPAIFDDSAEGGSKCIQVTGRSSNWHGTQIDISQVAQTGSEYQVVYWAKQTTGADMTLNTTLQYTSEDGDQYARQNSATIPDGEWTKVEFTTPAIPDHSGSMYFYWETSDTSDFQLDNFKFTGIVRSQEELEGIPDLSAGLIKEKIGNPIMTSRLTADPYVIEYEGRIYVYGTNDSQQYAEAPTADNNYSKINTLNCYSSADMVNWTDHGEIAVAGSKGAAKWASNSWAPAVAYKKIDGKDKFFLYFANNASSIGVLTADSPVGPWEDPIGKALIDRSVPGCGQAEVPWLFDPAVLVDDDGQGYIYFGGIGDTNGKEDSFIKNPKCARVAKLGADMVSIDGEAQMIDAPYMFEDSGINKFGDKYYYSYCTNWTDIDGRDVGTANIAVMVSDNPMTGFKYLGPVLKNPGSYFGAYGNNHHCFIDFKGTKYAFYHTKKDTTALGTPADYRTTYADLLNMGDNGDFTNSDGSVADTKMTAGGLASIGTVDPYDMVEAETFSMANKVGTQKSDKDSSVALWNAGNQVLFNAEVDAYVGVSNVVFGNDGAKAVGVKMSGTDGEDYKEYAADLKTKVTGEHTIYFVFEKCGVLVDSWKFYK